jgi:hypothetical protein
MDTVRYERKPLDRQLDLYTKTKIPLSNNLIALLEQSFPGVNRRFESPARKDESQKRRTLLELSLIQKAMARHILQETFLFRSQYLRQS